MQNSAIRVKQQNAIDKERGVGLVIVSESHYDHRTGLLDGFERFLQEVWVNTSLSCPIYLDGSFVRSKPIPSDIDVVIDLTQVTAIAPLAIALALRLRHDELKSSYTVDLWAKHPKLPKDLTVFFQYIGEKAAAELKLDSKHPKGILRIQP